MYNVHNNAQVVNGYVSLLAQHVKVRMMYFQWVILFVYIQERKVYPISSLISQNMPQDCHRKVLLLRKIKTNMLTYNCQLQDKLFEYDLWVAPIHLRAHWAMLVNGY